MAWELSQPERAKEGVTERHVLSWKNENQGNLINEWTSVSNLLFLLVH